MRPLYIIPVALLFMMTLTAASSKAAAEPDVLSVPIKKDRAGAPDGWKIREWRGKAAVSVVATASGDALHLKSAGTSTALYKDVSFDIRDRPRLNWRWKVIALPKGADVRLKSTDDQAAQVYVIFPKWPSAINSRIIGYIWDTQAPKGLELTSTKTSTTKYVVLRSGQAGLGQWFAESRDVYEDYKRLFKEEPPLVGSVSVMIDSDDTAGTAESYVADIYFSKSAAAK